MYVLLSACKKYVSVFIYASKVDLFNVRYEKRMNNSLFFCLSNYLPWRMSVKVLMPSSTEKLSFCTVKVVSVGFM